MADFTWTDRTVARLRELVGKKYSFAVIANMLTAEFPDHGSLTRSACIGKAHRAGIEAPRPPKKFKTAPPPQAARPPAQRGGAKGGAVPAPETAPPDLGPRDLSGAAAPAGGITFMQVRDGLCRWPTSKATDFENYRACGCACDVTERYCVEHKAKSRDKRRTEESAVKGAAHTGNNKRVDKRLYNPNSMFFMRRAVA